MKPVGSTPVEALCAMGLQHTEAEAYVTLLTHGPATGYALAQLIDRAPPAIYRALDSLALRGAVNCDGASPKVWTPVRPDRFLTRLREEFLSHSRGAADALMQLPVATHPQVGVSMIRSPVQAVRAAKNLVESCKTSLVADLSPSFVDGLRPEFEAAASRAVSVSLKAYQPVALQGCEVSIATDMRGVFGDLPCTVLICVGDARQMVAVLFDQSSTRVLAGIETSNLFLCGLRHEGIISEIHWDQLCHAIQAAHTEQDLVQLKALVEHQTQYGWRGTSAFQELMTGRGDPESDQSNWDG